MPIIIRELVIQANVMATDPNNNNGPVNNTNISDDDKRLIIEEAVQQVMEILERQKDR